jgi:adenine-specific DNA-methyltransferase
MSRKPKLELTWIGKDERPRLEPRILLEDPALSHHSATNVTGHDLFDNRLIFGDNLLALKALEQEFAGKVKCIYIDPPYNSGTAFTHYDDGVEHSLWLSLMRDRLEILRQLLSADGSLWISIDDSECHYLKVLGDEVFGRPNFVANVIWEKRKSRENRRVFSFNHDHILLYALDKSHFERTRNQLPLSDDVLARYRNPDNDPRGPWQSVSATAQAGHATASQFYELTAPSGRRFSPPSGSCWRYTQPRMEAEIRANNIWFGRGGTSMPRIKKFLRDNSEAGLTPETLWFADDVGTNDDAKRHVTDLSHNVEAFETPKPEALIARIISIATNPGDLVLDSFAGSGTTGAVAHKMGRRWIMVELGEHARTHIVPRLTKVIDGQDPGGITDAVNWKGGGGFRYFRLAPSLLEKDRWGNWVVSKQYNAAMLAEAVCKHEGFTYDPSPTIYWQHGRSTERDFVYVTTQTLTREQLDALSEEVGDERTLLVCCGAWRGDADGWPNLTLKKMPQAVLGRCEYGRDDYSLRVASLPSAPTDEPATDRETATPLRPKPRGRARKPAAPDENLDAFAVAGDDA